ncbi:TonB-dependent receptor [Sphingomonas sp. 37zxx]|uniref:TonB-dependent receptor n=1 Tax=Sphingomonas sp. 37zxx TaxID=1550073 RepID=UPI00053BEBB5|nr:TonB-dependent receptor [Sphingomonas sp. 37zxx]
MGRSTLFGSISFAALSVMLSSPALAQTTQPAPPPPQPQSETPPRDDPDGTTPAEIIVTGFRSSLQKGLDLKREAIGVRDSIVAEDIGKFPEQNVAESLQRIPGVFLSRDGASNEGQRISIRGLGSQFSVTTINGAPVRTTSSSNVGGASRDFNFDVFPSELFGRVDVYKTPLASLEEGGIGGNIDLQTPRPFDSAGRVIRYTATGQYNTASEKLNPRGSFLISETAGDFGVLIGVAYARSENLRSGFQSTGGYSPPALGPIGYLPAAQRPPGTLAGQFPFVLDFDSPRANLGGLSRQQVDNAFMPRFFRAYASSNERERLGATASLQYKTDTIDFSVDGIYANLTDTRDEFTFGVPVRNTRTIDRTAAPGRNNNNGLIPIDIAIDDNNNIFGTFGNAQLLSESYYYDAKTRFMYGIARGIWDATDNLKFSGQVNYSRSRAEYSANRIVYNAYNVDVTYDPTVDRVYPTISSPVDFTDPNTYRTSGNNDPSLGFFLNREIDEQKTARLVADYTPEPLGKLELQARFGASYVSTVKDAELRDGSALASSSQLPGGQTFRQLDIYGFMDPFVPIGALPNGGNDGFPSQWATFSRDFVNGTLDANGFNRAAPIRVDSSFRAEEQVTSLFFETDAKLPIGTRALRGNVGIRYSDTRTIINNAALINGVFTPNESEGGYAYWLPSFSLAFDIFDDLLIRGSAGKTITRASLSNIAGNTRIPNRFEARAIAGNPNLLPQIATQYDAGIEWYFAPGGLLSAGYFSKTLKDTTQSQRILVPFSSLGLPDNALGPTFQDANGRIDPDLPISLDTFFNSGTVKLSGLEFAYQQNFRFLPKPLDGLGVITSFTKINSQGNTFITTDGQSFEVNTVPDYSYSVTGFYERGPFALRGSYNYRDRTIIEVNNQGSNLQRWSAGQGFLDGTVSYRLSDALELRLDVLNLTNELLYDYFEDPRGLNGDPNSRLDNALYNGRTIAFGVRGSF